MAMIGSIAYFLAFIIYGLLSSPTPDALGIFEYIILALLVVAVGWNSFLAFIYDDYPKILSYHRAFLIYMVAVPSVIGIMAGYSTHNIIRDIMPVICLILPMVFYLYSKHHTILLCGGLFIGFAFTTRYVLTAITEIYTTQELLYLANSPLVPFATIMGFHYLSDVQKSSIFVRLFGWIMMSMGILAMAFMMQRAPLILTFVACMVIWGIRLPLRPLFMVFIAVVIAMAGMMLQSYLLDIIESFTNKTMTVGWNNRFEEFQSVIAHSTIWGYGWGAEWQSPAVADIWVRYTHNIISYYWLKAGVIGACMAVLFVGFWAWHIAILIRKKPAIGLAIAVPFLTHVTLYTGFKTLDFAILLALAVTLCPNTTNRANQS